MQDLQAGQGKEVVWLGKEQMQIGHTTQLQRM
jgi:hypothetical protein